MDVNVEGAVAEHHIRPPLRSPAKPDGVCVGAAGTHYRDIGIDFTAGCISGCTGIAVGQPFDTVKVRIQTQGMATAVRAAGSSAGSAAAASSGVMFPSAMACASEIVRKEGALALFKGMSTPLASAAFVNAITFAAYAQSQRVLTSHGLIGGDEQSNGESNVDTVSGGGASDSKGGRGSREGLGWSWVGGAFAGLCQTMVVIPTDNIKVKLQVQVGARGSDALRFKGPIDCALKVVRAEGLKGLFRGANATVFRDTPAIGTYFAVYEGMKEYLERRWRLGEQASSFGAGGLAGAVSWLMIYPFDMVKSVQQAATDPLDPSTRSMTACFRSLYHEAGGGLPGVSRFFRGLSPTIARAFPVNAVIFPVYEWTVKVLNQATPPVR